MRRGLGAAYVAWAWMLQAIFSPAAFGARLDPATCRARFAQFRQENRIQDQIWVLREGGQDARADAIEQDLRKRLATLPIVGRLEIGMGHTRPEKITLADGTQAVLKRYPKAAQKFGYRSEVAAYVLDRLLGLNVVPVTVEREIHGDLYSVQYFMAGAEQASKVRRLSRVLANDRVRLLDYLSANLDPQGKNLLINAEGRQIAVDQELTFGLLSVGADRAVLEAMVQELLKPGFDRALLHRLRLVPDHLIRAGLDGLMPKGAIDGLIRRKQVLLDVAQSVRRGN